MPKSAFPESYHSGNSRMLNWLLTNKLREFACTLRNAHVSGQSMDSIHAVKSKMLEEVNRILTISLGEPPIKFDWTFRDKEKKYKSYKDQSPVEFYKTIVDYPLENTVSLINDPRNEMNQLFTVEYLGNVVGGRPVTYINVPIEQLKKYTIKSIKDNRPVWFGCDVSKFLHRPSGVMDTKLFDYELTFGVQLNLNKADRLRYGESAMTHAMTITGVDIEDKSTCTCSSIDVSIASDEAKGCDCPKGGKPIKWRIENSWGEDSGDKGYLCMTDEWFDEFTYQVVIRKDELEDDILEIMKGETKVLPPWDPMGALA